MKNFLISILVLTLGGGILAFSSCAGLPSAKDKPSFAAVKVKPVPGHVPESPMSSSTLPVPEHGIVEIPLQAEYIMGEGIVSGEKLAAFLLQTNNGADEDFVRLLSAYYVEEAAVEGVNHDTAFAQMCLETGFLRYGGLVTPDMNNFCGLGSIGPGENGHFFPDPRAGVRAHIQHLQAYASTEPLNQELIDPRYHYVKRGSSPTIYGLSGTWAADRYYDVKISRILRNLYEFSF
jgi:hypothetical protein